MAIAPVLSKRCPRLWLTLGTRFQIEGDAPAWQDAEEQVRKATKDGRANTVVSVKSGKQKRKAGQTAAEVYEEAFADKTRRKAKKARKAP